MWEAAVQYALQLLHLIYFTRPGINLAAVRLAIGNLSQALLPNHCIGEA